MKPHVLVHCAYEDYAAALRADAREGLTAPGKRLSVRWSLDGRGRRLLDRITGGGDYRFGAAERELVGRLADPVIRAMRPHTLVHVGPTGLRAARPLWQAARRHTPMRTVNFCDTPHSRLGETLRPLSSEFAHTDWYGLVSALPAALPALPGDPPRLLWCLGEWFTALSAAERRGQLTALRARCSPGDRLLVTTTTEAAQAMADLSAETEPAAEFNRNVLYVLNHVLDTECLETSFDHTVSDRGGRAELRLRARTAFRLPLTALGFGIELAAGEEIATFGMTDLPHDRIDGELTAAGFRPRDRWTDDGHGVTVTLAEAA
ncbi:L-histidine N-alpha-methyltransferase [Stackebrandtia albiflava]|uniref:L-histidine N-alpha-methyltransferase n=1 Tax=Stackebrandtia albiflava TaxID=406432 RepID=A0A562URB0_9ACTN|nr:L-histidine N(alpha)-methyltransferase [Stackebrandtia albiflava]TWJ08153.1 L-histidine N-alpha-methyltransferase [Stackebrandtia albiflava]